MRRTRKKKRVVVIGGGVAGMSAAHELIERGFAVEVFEAGSIPGGKARSVEVTNAEYPPWAPGGRAGARVAGRPLPGEHGFRFFPGFYAHVTDTMKRIPYGLNRRGVFDNLVAASQVAMARDGRPPIILGTKPPAGPGDLMRQLDSLLSAHVDIPGDEVAFFAERVWQLMTSCPERQTTEYERLGWWEFTGADGRSEDYRKFLVNGITRSLVAAKADLASTLTIGSIFTQLVYDMMDARIDVDRVLDGPTNDVWIDPWLGYLRACGVDYRLDARVVGITCRDGLIEGVTIEGKGRRRRKVRGDYYVAAVPVEVMARLVTEEMVKADPTLAQLDELAKNVDWMNGMQIYLRREFSLAHGHWIFVDSAAAITSLSQRQFWSPDIDWSEWGDGEVRGVISVDISDWSRYRFPKLRPEEITKEAIFLEVWGELKRSLTRNGRELLEDGDVHSYYLDEDIVFLARLIARAGKAPRQTLHQRVSELRAEHLGPSADARDADDPEIMRLRADLRELLSDERGGERLENKEPLLVNLVGSRHLRPAASTGIPNLFLASDYVLTNTDLATMEGANEAARRAVNCIIAASGSRARLCRIWPLAQPEMLAQWRDHDRERFARGLPWEPALSPWMLLHPGFVVQSGRFAAEQLAVGLVRWLTGGRGGGEASARGRWREALPSRPVPALEAPRRQAAAGRAAR